MNALNRRKFGLGALSAGIASQGFCNLASAQSFFGGGSTSTALVTNFSVAAPQTISGTTAYNQLGVISIPGSSIQQGGVIRCKGILTSASTNTTTGVALLGYLNDYETGWVNGDQICGGSYYFGNGGGSVVDVFDINLDIYSTTEFNCTSVLSGNSTSLQSGASYTQSLRSFKNGVIGLGIDVCIVVVCPSTSATDAITLQDFTAQVIN